MRTWGAGMACAGIALLCLTAATRVAAAEIDWAAVEEEASAWLQDYIRIDTSNPPGNEISAATFLADRFHRAGIEAESFEAAPGRGSVLARVRGSGARRPIILLNHLDVVPASPEGWTVPPFAATVREGYIYGRGALDCKGPATVEAMALLLLKRYGIQLTRDVIFLGTADEESGGRLGAGWMTNAHRELLANAEFLLNEGGSVVVRPDGVRAYEVAVAEKTPCWLKLEANGKPGHGAAPPTDTAVTRLVRALARLDARQMPLRVTPEVQAYYAALATAETGARRIHFADLRAALAHQEFRSAFLLDPHDAALVRDTITPTVLNGSLKTNVIPPHASAELDCRLLPGEDAQAFVHTIKKTIADPKISVSVLLSFPAISSPRDTALVAAVREMAERDGAVLVPSVLTGFTDSHYFRELGIASYGFIPFDLNEAEAAREHGVDERLSISNLRLGTQRLLELLRRLGD